MKTAGLLLLMAVLSGCGTLMRGTEQEVAIQTEPAGAKVVLSDGNSCTSPCTVTAARYQTLTLTIRKDGCLEAIRQVIPSVPESGSFWLSVYDYQLGGAYDLEPNPLRVSLTCGEAARARTHMLGLTAEDEAVMEAFGKVYQTP